MAPVDPTQPLSLDEVASSLDLHPLDVARLLGHVDELPPRLRFERSDLERLSSLAGIESWWDGQEVLPEGDPARSVALIRLLAGKLLVRDLSGERTTRADNLLRGLGPADQRRLRAAINALIRARLLRTSSSWRGLQVAVDPAWYDILAELARGAALPDALVPDRSDNSTHGSGETA